MNSYDLPILFGNYKIFKYGDVKLLSRGFKLFKLELYIDNDMKMTFIFKMLNVFILLLNVLGLGK